MNQILPTSIVGSLPKPSWLARPETLWAPWKLQGDELVEGKQDALRIAAKEQSDRGIDIVSDGEQTRQHFVTTFIEHLDGVNFEQRETVRIRNRYDANVPTVVGAVSRSKPVFVDDARFLRQQTDQPIKWALPGPMTMIDTLYDGHYQSREKLAWEFATILNQEARDLEAAGVDIIQFDEPAFNVYFDEMKDWGVATLERATEGLRTETAVHICYGYGIKANTDWKATLGSEWRQYEESFPPPAAVQHRHHLAGMPQLPRPDRPRRTRPGQEGHARCHRRGEREDRDSGGSRRHHSEHSQVRRRGQASAEHELRHGALLPRHCTGEVERAQRGYAHRS